MLFVLHLFLACLFVNSLGALVPQYASLTDFGPDIFSSIGVNRHIFAHLAAGYSDSKYGDATTNLGIFESINLKNLAKSADVYSREMGNGEYLPEMLQLIPRWQGKNIPFSTDTSFRSQRISIAYKDFIQLERYADEFEQGSIKKRLAEGAGIVFGVSVPFIQVQSVNQYVLNKNLDTAYVDVKNADPVIESKLETLRAQLFKKIGLAENVWDKRGLGDVECYVGLQTHVDYYLRLRTLDANILVGLTMPTGGKKDPEYPSSVPFGANSFGLSLQSNIKIGLKDYLHVGFNSGLAFFSTRSAIMRVPVYEEPMAYSPLVTSIRIIPGGTYWFNPFLTIKNISNDLHLTLNYSFIWHSVDEYFDERRDATSLSVFSRAVNDDLGIVFKDRNTAKNSLVKASRWFSRNFGLTLTYDPYQVRSARTIVPYFNFGFQYAHNGVNVPAVHQLHASVSVDF